MIKKTLTFSNKAYLSYKLKQLVIRRENPVTNEEEVITRPIEDNRHHNDRKRTGNSYIRINFSSCGEQCGSHILRLPPHAH